MMEQNQESASIIQISDDGGIRKEILKEGAGPVIPLRAKAKGFTLLIAV
jgi:hypothetical protein